MGIEEIPSDELIEMTELFHRAFNAAGCNPACHCCYHFINVGDNFKLSTVREVKINSGDSANSSNVAFERDRLKVLTGEIESSERVKDITHEVMLCKYCTSDLFQKKQLDKVKDLSKKAQEYYDRGGGCFRVNGKIIH